MHVGRSHRVQLRLPVQLDSADRSRSFTGETIDLSRGGLSARFQVEDSLPSIAWARIDAAAVGGGAIVCKAQRVWQGGLPGGETRANYRILRIQPASRERLDQLIESAVRHLVADLGDLPLFGDADIRELEYLLTLGRVRERAAGSSLYERGRYDAAGVYVVLDGRAAIECGETTQVLGRGLAFGQWAEEGVEPHKEGAQAGGALRYLYLPASFHPEVAVQAPGISGILRNALGANPHSTARRTARALGGQIPS
ncbi:MAG: hypothetical protein GF330_06365 [Candidatus Eisenbacteria bacterium]|nr:hypothetical protein [Candidatus Eisenbacteria bacterium]